MGVSDFVKKMMFAHQLDFKEGRFEMLGVRGILLPAFTLTRIIEYTYGKIGQEVFDILFEAGKEHGRMAIDEVGESHSMSKNEFLRKMVESGNVMGVGKMSLKEFDQESGTAKVVLEESPFAAQLSESEKLRGLDRPVDDFVRGLLYGIFSDIFDSDSLEVVEESCAFQEGDICSFRILAGSG